MSKPLVSIITPAYNAARFVEKAIQSVKAQSYANWEHVIVDDHSKDNTAEIVARHATSDSRIKLLHNPGPNGPAPTRNVALKAATGDYIAFLDATTNGCRKNLKNKSLSCEPMMRL
jgi:teichuronic acid biosynthesis glycosyltransferase TuaG